MIIINETAAERLFPDREPVGQTVLAGDRRFEWRVVGVVSDVRHQSLEQAPGLEMYMPLTQFGWAALDMVVRSSLPAESLVPTVRAALQVIDPTIATGDFQTLDAVVDRAASARRFIVLLLGAFAGSALLLAALGIYGVLSYSVAEQSPEIGIRMALGASGADVRWRVVGRTLVLAGFGVAIGTAASIAGSSLIASLLFGVQPADPMTFAGMIVVLLTVAGLAGLIPATRASQTDVLTVLRG